MKSVVAALLIALVAGIAPATAFAQPGPAAQTRGSAAKREQIRQRLRAARAWKLTDALNLSERDVARLAPILNKYDEAFFALQRDGAKLRRQLREQTGSPSPDKAALNRLIDELLSHQKKMWELSRQRFAEVRQVLAPEQAAKALIVLPEIDRALVHQVRRAVRGRR